MYLVGEGGRYVLFDCGWQDSFPVIKAAMREYGVGFGQLIGVFVSHFHPDHAGTVELLRRHGVKPLILACQTPHIDWLNAFFAAPKNDPRGDYVTLDRNDVTPLSFAEARELLRENGIDGEIIHTPGHSEDSVSLIIGGSAFIGDLQRYDGVASWEALRQRGLTNIYAGHQVLPFWES
jgi:glyoxylase-like metal-dependent hydrolase (beta-lactamase superfamily II)